MPTNTSSQPQQEKQIVSSNSKSLSQQAAQQSVQGNSTCMQLPLVGKITIPPPEDLAWYVGVGFLGVVGAVDWPIIGIVSLGKLLSQVRRNKTLQDFGQALEEVS